MKCRWCGKEVQQHEYTEHLRECPKYREWIKRIKKRKQKIGYITITPELLSSKVKSQV